MIARPDKSSNDSSPDNLKYIMEKGGNAGYQSMFLFFCVSHNDFKSLRSDERLAHSNTMTPFEPPKKQAF